MWKNGGFNSPKSDHGKIKLMSCHTRTLENGCWICGDVALAFRIFVRAVACDLRHVSLGFCFQKSAIKNIPKKLWNFVPQLFW